MKTVSGGKLLISALTVPLAVGLIAGPAHAYPPGNKTEVFVKKTSVKPGKAVVSRAVNVKPGCVVTFDFRGPVNRSPRNSFDKRIKSKANKNGVASAKLKRGPKKPGKYKVIIRSGGNGCPPARSTTSFKVAKKTPAKG